MIGQTISHFVTMEKLGEVGSEFLYARREARVLHRLGHLHTNVLEEVGRLAGAS